MSFRRRGKMVSEDEIKKMFQELSLDPDSKIQYDEFTKIITEITENF